MQKRTLPILGLLFVALVAAWLVLQRGATPWGITNPIGMTSESSAGGHSHAGSQHAESQYVPMFDVNVTEAFLFKPQEGKPCKLTYRLVEPARVSIRIKKKETRELYLATIVGWAVRQKGRHEERWDGRDYSGNFVDMSEATLSVVAEKLAYREGSLSLEARGAEEIVHGEKEHIHGTHHSEAEEVPLLRIAVPKAGMELRGQVLIRSEVDRQKRGYGDQFGYGVRYYVDSVLANEESYKPESNGRFAYTLDTSAFEDGKHMLYVGICDHHQHATSAGVEVFIRNSPK